MLDNAPRAADRGSGVSLFGSGRYGFTKPGSAGAPRRHIGAARVVHRERLSTAQRAGVPSRDGVDGEDGENALYHSLSALHCPIALCPRSRSRFERGYSTKGFHRLHRHHRQAMASTRPIILNFLSGARVQGVLRPDRAAINVNR